MLTIKLSKIGKTNKKVFRLIISEKSRDPYGRALEILGSYNPYLKALQAKGERIKYWLSKGAQMTPTVNNLLVQHQVIDGKKVKASKVGVKNEKRAAQLKVKEDKKATPQQEEAPVKKEAETASPEPSTEEVKESTETSENNS